MHYYLSELLLCPACHGELKWWVERETDRVEQASAYCASCPAKYRVRAGIAEFLTPDLPRNDLWEAGGGLGARLRDRPDAERRLMSSPLTELNAADRLLRAFALEDRGEFAAAGPIASDAMRDVYADDYLERWRSQTRWLLDRLTGSDEPILDIASGRGYLVEAMARELRAPIIASDFSPRVLRRDRARLRDLGLDHRVVEIAFDARRSPFRDGAVTRMTSNLGLANIEEPGGLAAELRRILSGEFLAIHFFYPEDDGENARVLRKLKLDQLAFRRTAIEYLESAGLRVEVTNLLRGLARPTPRSALTGMPVDLLPVAETVLDWCVLSVR